MAGNSFWSKKIKKFCRKIFNSKEQITIHRLWSSKKTSSSINSFKDFGAKNAVVAKVGAKKAGRQKMLFGSKKLRLVAADVVVEASEQAADAAPAAADVSDADADTWLALLSCVVAGKKESSFFCLLPSPEKKNLQKKSKVFQKRFEFLLLQPFFSLFRFGENHLWAKYYFSDKIINSGKFF